MSKNKKIVEGRTYLLSWRHNPSTWNESLKDLIENNEVEKINKHYYTKVTAHFTGRFDIVDCTCDERGNYYPINTTNLKEMD